MPHINSNRVRNHDRRFERISLLRRKEKNGRPNHEHPNGEHFRAQNKLRILLDRVRPRSLKPQQELGTGVDYVFAGKKIDFKFGFGTLGKDTISVRMKNGELLNKSDWTMVCNERGDIYIFNTNKIRSFVKINGSVMKKNMFLNKGTYTMHKVNLNEMLGSVQYQGNIRTAKGFLRALKKMNHSENLTLPQRNPFLMVKPTRQRLKTIGQTLANGNHQRPTFDRRISPRINH